MITASAGNHAQGVAFSARHLGVNALIVMPQTTPEDQGGGRRELGAGVELAGDTFADAKARCDELTAASGRVLIHPFDDPLVIAGQGTIAMEILGQGRDDLTRDLRAGRRWRPDCGIAQLREGDSARGQGDRRRAVRSRCDVPIDRSRPPFSLDRVGIFADGVAVREVGTLTFPIVQASVDEVIRVSNDEICAAIKDVFDDTRSLMEPAGALAVAGLRAWVARTDATGQNLVAVLSGANMDFDRLRFVAERAEVGEAREALFGVTIPERPGAFREFCATIGRRVVTEFNYRLSSRTEAHIFVGIAHAVEAERDRPDGVAARQGLSDDRLDRRRSGEAAHSLHGRRPRA